MIKKYLWIFFSERLALKTAQMEKLEKNTNMNRNIPYNYGHINADKRALSSQQSALQLTTHFTVRKHL